jgi:ParB family chromosome partitioning protein
VSPKLIDVYAEDGMTLEQLMAFTVCPDHKRQEKVWTALEKSWEKHPHSIRRMLMEKSVPARDKRTAFVTVEAYQAAGGTILTDLFDDNNGGWLEDVPLLERLVAEKLRAEAEKIAAEGWKWIEVQPSFPYGHTHGLVQIDGVPLDLTDEEQATIAALKAEYAKLEATYEQADEVPEDIDQRLGEIESALAAFDDRPVEYEPADIARAGCFVSLDSDGTPCVERGYVRRADAVASTAEGQDGEVATSGDATARESLASHVTVITVGGKSADGEEDEEGGIKPLPEKLVMELTAHRTLALRDALAGSVANFAADGVPV